MKKIIIFLLTLLIPTSTFAIDNCSVEQYLEYKNQVKDVKYDINLKKGTDEEEYEYYYEIRVSKLPKDYFIAFDNSTSLYTFYPAYDYIAVPSGGLYDVNFYSLKCAEQSLRGFNLYLPTINEKQSSHSKSTKIITNKKLSRVVIIILTLGIALLLALLFIIFKRRKRRSKNEN